MIVEADADVEDAAARCAANAFSFAGQSCISVQRIYVQRDVYEDFKARFLPKVEALVVGDPADEATDVGPLISPGERDRVLAWIEQARAGGATILTGGDARRRAPPPHRRRGARRRRAARLRRGLRPRLHAAGVRHARRGDRRSRTRPATGCRQGSSRLARVGAAGRRQRSSSAGSRSTRPPPSAPTRCPTAASRNRATRARARPGPCAR